MWIGCSTPRELPPLLDEDRPHARPPPAGRPRARTSGRGKRTARNPSSLRSPGYKPGATAKARSRFTAANSRMTPLCIHNHRPCRKGWQFVCWIAVPVEARMWAKTSGDSRWHDRSFRFRSLQAGSTLRKSAGVSAVPYQPIPNPSPFVVVAPSCEWRLWSISEWAGLNSKLLQRHRGSRVRQPSTHLVPHRHRAAKPTGYSL